MRGVVCMVASTGRADPDLRFPNIYKRYKTYNILSYLVLIYFKISFHQGCFITPRNSGKYDRVQFLYSRAEPFPLSLCLKITFRQ
jgi:hypothetical protein